MLSSRMHKYLALLWATLAIPTILWWHDSILWISLVSLYANGVGHWAAFQASKAEEKVDPPPSDDKPCLTQDNPFLIRDEDGQALYDAICRASRPPPSPPNHETGSPPSLPSPSPSAPFRNDEKAQRMYYQGIVYRVCNLLELTKEDATPVRCGTADTPTIEVEVELAVALKELATLRKKLRDQ